MLAIRLSFLVALLVAVVHAIAAYGSDAALLVAARNLLWWQCASALAGALIAASTWPFLRKRAQWVALAISPTLIVGLEISAWLVAGNFHHSLGSVLRLLAFGGAFLLPAALLFAFTRRPLQLRWMTPLQIALLVAALLLQWTISPKADEPGDRPDLALIVIDAVQVRALGHMGAPLEPSPRLDALARTGWTSDAGFSAAATSIPGHAAILFGLDVLQHRAPTNDFDLPQDLPLSLAGRLREQGYTTMGFCQNPLVSSRSGFARGFDVWWNWGEQAWLNQPAPVAMLQWPAAYLWSRASHGDRVTLTARAALPSARGPLFTFIQLLYTHHPYVDGDGWATAQRIAEIEALIEAGAISNRTSYAANEVASLYAAYLGSVAYSDRLVGEMVDLLSSRAGERGLVIVVTADHGENLAEHGDEAIAEHYGPWSTTLRVPLIVHDTRVSTKGVRGQSLSSNQHIARLLLHAADGLLPLEAEDWALRVGEELALDPAFIYSEPWLVLVDDSLKVAIDRTDLAAAPIAHRWREDFEDRQDLSGLPIIEQRWQELLELHQKMGEAGILDAPASIDPEKLEHLRTLGYID